MLTWLIHFLALFGILLLLDWVFPDRIWMFAIGLFRDSPDSTREIFSRYRAGFRLRVALAFTLSLIGVAILHTNIPIEFHVVTAVTIITGYVIVLGVSLFRARALIYRGR